MYLNQESMALLVSIIDLPLYTLIFMVCGLANMDLCVCDFAICDI